MIVTEARRTGRENLERAFQKSVKKYVTNDSPTVPFSAYLLDALADDIEAHRQAIADNDRRVHRAIDCG